jgi:hypothetical protein
MAMEQGMFCGERFAKERKFFMDNLQGLMLKTTLFCADPWPKPLPVYPGEVWQGPLHKFDGHVRYLSYSGLSVHGDELEHKPGYVVYQALKEPPSDESNAKMKRFFWQDVESIGLKNVHVHCEKVRCCSEHVHCSSTRTAHIRVPSSNHDIATCRWPSSFEYCTFALESTHMHLSMRTKLVSAFVWHVRMEVLCLQPWDYFWHFKPEAVRKGAPWNLLKMQGTNGVLWAGSSCCFESVLDVMAYNEGLMSMFQLAAPAAVQPTDGATHSSQLPQQ